MTEVDALIVRNIKELDGAATRVRSELQKQIGQELNTVVESWADKEGWKGVFDWYGEKDDIWVAASDWRGDDEDDEHDYDFWFMLTLGEGRDFEDYPDGDQFWLTTLCGAGRATLGFLSGQDAYKYPKGRRWKAKIEPFVQELVKLGFSYEDKTGQVFLPVTIEQERLARAIENEDIQEALGPIAVALDHLIQAKPIIDQLRASAKGSD
jgi:hypothetical protein